MLGNLIVSWAAKHTNLCIEVNVYGSEGFLDRIVWLEPGARYDADPANGRSRPVRDANGVGR